MNNYKPNWGLVIYSYSLLEQWYVTEFLKHFSSLMYWLITTTIIQQLFEDLAKLHFSYDIEGISEITQECRSIKKHYHFNRPIVWGHIVRSIHGLPLYWLLYDCIICSLGSEDQKQFPVQLSPYLQLFTEFSWCNNLNMQGGKIEVHNLNLSGLDHNLKIKY